MSKPKPKVGRPRRGKRPATKILGIRVTNEEHALITRAAGYAPASVWGRNGLIKLAKQTLGIEDEDDN